MKTVLSQSHPLSSSIALFFTISSSESVRAAPSPNRPRPSSGSAGQGEDSTDGRYSRRQQWFKRGNRTKLGSHIKHRSQRPLKKKRSTLWITRSMSSVSSVPPCRDSRLELIHALGVGKTPSSERTGLFVHWTIFRFIGAQVTARGSRRGSSSSLAPSLCPKRRRILVREKVTKNWNGKSTECPFARWSDGGGGRRTAMRR